ncbi:hypothetical protein YDYSG_03010 [Paenibacillus tyrfis]|nr:hypothetical protein YDYSG_03010 [Paenibacillus tyrfis]
MGSEDAGQFRLNRLEFYADGRTWSGSPLAWMSEKCNDMTDLIKYNQPVSLYNNIMDGDPSM